MSQKELITVVDPKKDISLKRQSKVLFFKQNDMAKRKSRGVAEE
ncbi:MAG: hypothetical protein OEV64_08770 [Desulfobulbaceae bacterium]|nr:hypothetical protein [Desulfobulbaceae bacterium]